MVAKSVFCHSDESTEGNSKNESEAYKNVLSKMWIILTYK